MNISKTMILDYEGPSLVVDPLPIPSPQSTQQCDVFYEEYPDPSSSVYTIIPFALFYSTIFVLGLAGNFAIIYVTLKHRTLQTVQNMFILNLAASDIIVCLLSLPITPVTNIYKNWFFGSVLCRLIPWVQGVSIFICTFSLGAIAVDRYILVVHPHTPPLSKQGALYVTVILWSLSIIVTIPYAVYMYVETYEGICGSFCTEKWPNPTSRRVYTMVVMIGQFVLPFALMAFCYATIFSRLRNRAKVKLRKMDACSHALEGSQPSVSPLPNKNGSGGEKNRAQLIDQKGRGAGRHRILAQTRRTTMILASMVVMFGLTWLPHNVVSIILEYDDSRTIFSWYDHDVSYLINLFTHSIAMTNNISNPVLYAWLNPTFRQLVIETFFGRKSRRNVGNVEQKCGGPRMNGCIIMDSLRSTMAGAKSECTTRLTSRAPSPLNGGKEMMNGLACSLSAPQLTVLNCGLIHAAPEQEQLVVSDRSSPVESIPSDPEPSEKPGCAGGNLIYLEETDAFV
ncbi:hypothetical protein PENTCL1PPCAC_28511 [Pristionchus entomophagus]|uniref:G-protein coupled receptors family 1 profile domain-containing protein n=1 Tax=Pristionchus entomophagus TaxID=358040 RepID=A0AAV5UHA8_9BILA|nr:hypothetical protein PENTCL1PPCAC_28511 [Pristionchus entomophagus]